MQSVTVSYRAARRLERGHTWIFRSDLEKVPDLPNGATVKVLQPSGKLLGTAHYSSTSQIALRLLDTRERAIDTAFLRERLEAAIAFRRQVVRDSDSFRLVHSEADLLPGLVVDQYADCLAIQTLSQGMDILQPQIVAVLMELLSPRAIVEKNGAHTRTLEGLEQRQEIVSGCLEDTLSIRLNGLRFEVDLLGGQKTGFFLDQRENYAAAGRHAKGRGLDCFTYAGGFALHMASGCDHVEGVDASEAAVAQATRNAKVNGLSNVQFREADVFQLLASYQGARRHFDTIVLDPPAFTKSRAKRDDAARGYKEINLRALRLLEPGGILVTCSCSHHMSARDLMGIIEEAAAEVRRPLRLLETRSQAADHPILVGVPETEYLKGFVLQVIR
jgi:23S rRNA (cytosine1962-C5)-methyltransferase